MHLVPLSIILLQRSRDGRLSKDMLPTRAGTVIHPPWLASAPDVLGFPFYFLGFPFSNSVFGLLLQF